MSVKSLTICENHGRVQRILQPQEVLGPGEADDVRSALAMKNPSLKRRTELELQLELTDRRRRLDLP